MGHIEQIRAFVQIVESGSTTAAADQLNVAVSAVSRRLKDLELRLGAPLIHRTTRRMTLTDVGQSFYQRSRQILEDLSMAEEEVQESEAELRGRLKIAAPITFGVSHLSPVLSEFMHTHPQMRIDLDLDDRKVDLIDGGYDLAIRIGILKDSTLIARKISHSSSVICASPDFLNAHPDITHPEDLNSLPALCYSNIPRPNVWHYHGRIGKEPEPGSITLQSRLVCSNGDAMREVAIAGLGILREPSFIVHDAIKRGLLVPILTDWSWPSMDIFALYPKTTRIPRRTREFVDFIAKRFGDKPYWEG